MFKNIEFGKKYIINPDNKLSNLEKNPERIVDNYPKINNICSKLDPEQTCSKINNNFRTAFVNQNLDFNAVLKSQVENPVGI